MRWITIAAAGACCLALGCGASSQKTAIPSQPAEQQVKLELNVRGSYNDGRETVVNASGRTFELLGTVQPSTATVSIQGGNGSGGFGKPIRAHVEAGVFSVSLRVGPGKNDIKVTGSAPGLKSATQLLGVFGRVHRRSRHHRRRTVARRPPTSRRTSTAKAPSSPCITRRGYGGLYAPVSAFKANNNMTAPTQPIPGIDWYTILSTTHGCVAAYAVDELARPPLGARDIAFLTDGIDLPDDHTQPVERSGCIVFRSPTLTKATGFDYARTVATGQRGDVPAHAEIHLTNSAECP